LRHPLEFRRIAAGVSRKTSSGAKLAATTRDAMMFRDRSEAGRALAESLAEIGVEHPVVFGIPRGGVILGLEVARRLAGLLDVIVPAKIRAPSQPELGLGAVAPDGSTYLDEQTIKLIGVDQEYLRREIEERQKEIVRRMITYRGDRPLIPLEGKTAVIVDDGIATGGTAIAAARSVRSAKPERLILAVPVAPRSSLSKLESEVDRVVCLRTPEPFVAVGAWYEDFGQVTDEQVREAIQQGVSS
jgi:putative phosphoribosyl transferase